MVQGRGSGGWLTVAVMVALATLTVNGLGFAQGRPLSAALTGAAEVPGPGDPDGSGTAELTLNPGQEQICWAITVSNITLPAAAAHIHVGPAGIAGPVVVTLSAPGATGVANGCATVGRELVQAIIQSPELFYVNVHTSDFPAGAVRGQVSK